MNSGRSQAAVEFLSVYGYMFIIVAIVIATIALFINLPSYTLPFQCTFYSGFTCSDATLLMTNGGSALVLEATAAQPGVVAVQSFNAVLNAKSSTSGYCTPQNVIQGQTIYCVADFGFTPNPTLVYSGTFDVYSNYCAVAPQNVSTVSCTPASNTIFGGSIRVQPTASAISVNAIIANAVTTSYYVPITIVNQQYAPSSAPFQQEITFLPSNTAYTPYESNTLGNIRFYYYNTELPSWCEINCLSNSVTNAIFWVRLPFAIQPSSNVVIKMEFLSNTVGYDGVFAGEAPNQSANYAQYDNGNVVFNFYDDFAGSSLSALWIPANQNGGKIMVSNGLLLESTGSNEIASITSNIPFTTTVKSFIVEALLNAYGSSGTGIMDNMTAYAGTGLATVNYGYYSKSSGAQPQYYWLGTYTGTAVPLPSAATNYNIMDQQMFSNLSYFTWNDISYPGGSLIMSNGITVGITGQIRPEFFTQTAPGSSSTSQLYIEFVRIRGMPPNYVMPSAVMGPVTQQS